MTGKLYLIPTTIGDNSPEKTIPTGVIKQLSSIRHFIVEDVRTARRYFASAGLTEIIDQSTFFVLNKHTLTNEINSFLNPLLEGNNAGLLSESGLPCIADPGNIVVALAHLKNIKVVPLSGPSSIFLALMSSGFNGQNFAFNGYLPIEPNERKRKVIQLEKRLFAELQTQIFFETPFRNNQLMKDLLEVLKPETILCIASEITLEEELIQSKPVSEWKKNIPDLHKKMCIFIIGQFPSIK
jgi:16S rRNA (cytidine1402-2'-O)-methyltransferase